MKTQYHETEAQFLESIVTLAQLKGWRVHHVFEQRSYARRVGVGFPDCVMVKQGKPIIFAEIKSETGKLSEEQEIWLNALRRPGILAVIWKPSDWESIMEALE